jgi:hypothetical protein
MCPQCAWVQVEHCLAKQKARLLACEHYHVIFAMPHALNTLWLANVDVMSGLLIASVHDTWLELLGDAKYLGARPGIIATQHTWSQTLVLHPHIHCLVTGGRAVQPGVEAARGRLGGTAVDWSRGHLTLIRESSPLRLA